MMKIWASNDKEIQFTEISDEYISINIFTTEYVIGTIITRFEAISLCSALAESCGFPLFVGDEEE